MLIFYQQIKYIDIQSFIRNLNINKKQIRVIINFNE